MAKTIIVKRPIIDPNPQTERTVSEYPASISREMLGQILLLSLFAFVGGLLITTIVTTAIDFQHLPNKLIEIVNADGTKSYQPAYPGFRQFAITTAESPMGTEKSKFTEIGLFGTGLYMYGISNAYHWMLELGIMNFQGLLLFPLMAIFIASLFLMIKVLPPELKTRNRIFNYSILIGVFHSLFVVVTLTLAYVISSSFSSLFQKQFLYVGQILGIMIPSLCIIIFTNLFYGAVVGGILSAFIPEETE